MYRYMTFDNVDEMVSFLNAKNLDIRGIIAMEYQNDSGEWVLVYVD